MVNFHNRFLPHVAHILQPLYRTLGLWKANDWVDWTPKQIQTFFVSKFAVLLAHPAPWPSITFTTDASDGAVTKQHVASEWKYIIAYIAYFSIFDQELLALYLAMHHFCFLLEGHSFTAYIDHKMS